jgi:hypothetical protein
VHAELAVHVAKVGLHRVLAHEQGPSDLGVAQAGHDEGEQLALPLAEAEVVARPAVPVPRHPSHRPGDHLLALGDALEVLDELARRQRLREVASGAALQRGVDERLAERERVHGNVADPRVGRHRCDPIEAEADVPERVEQRDVHVVLGRRAGVELHDLDALGEGREHLRQPGEDELEVVHEGDADRRLLLRLRRVHRLIRHGGTVTPTPLG